METPKTKSKSASNKSRSQSKSRSRSKSRTRSKSRSRSQTELAFLHDETPLEVSKPASMTDRAKNSLKHYVDKAKALAEENPKAVKAGAVLAGTGLTGWIVMTAANKYRQKHGVYPGKSQMEAIRNFAEKGYNYGKNSLSNFIANLKKKLNRKGSVKPDDAPKSAPA
jgi:hypothetical protein